MKRPQFNEMTWLQFDWMRPFEFETVTEMLTHLAAHFPQVAIIFEVRGTCGQVKYYLGIDRQYVRIVTDAMKAHGDIRFTEVSGRSRMPASVSAQLKISKSRLSLNTELVDAVTRASHAALSQPKEGEQVLIQIILGSPYSPSPMPQTIPDPHASFLQKAFGNVEPATMEAKNAVKDKISIHGFNAVIRLGATADTFAKAHGHILSLLSALRTLRSAGVSISAAAEKPEKLNFAHVPWQFPLRLSVKEVANFLLLPIGEAELPGVLGLHPKQIMPPTWYRNPYPVNDRTFAVSLDDKHRLSISPKDSLEHTVILGPTGSGKSTAMQRMILSDIYAGKGCLVIDPKADLVDAVLARIPKHREDDLVIIDPSSPNPVGFNPLAYKNVQNPGLIADAILAVMQQIFADNWGIRSQDVISATLLTLVQAEGSSLLWLPTVLTDEGFRKAVTANIKDKVGLEPFWTSFEAMRDSERKQEIAPTLSKIRQLLLRSGLRNILGQSQPKFDLNDLFTKQKIVLVPLNKGLIGSESAKLLGAILVGITWVLALGRAAIPEEKRKPVSIFIDELQDYISSISADFSDALAQARGLGVGFTVAHQYREQLPPEIRAGVDANARNKICFGLSATDAKAMASMAPELSPEDFMALPRYHIYTSFNQEGKNTGWVSGKTMPITRALRNAADMKKKVSERYGMPGSEVEREYLELLASCRPESEPEVEAAPIGRRPKL